VKKITEIKKGKLTFKIKDNLTLDYGHKLRGFFANKFENVLFHNYEDNKNYRYGYPLIQYKILRGKPTVISLNEGVSLITKNFLEINKLTLAEKEYKKPTFDLQVYQEHLFVEDQAELLPYKYDFLTPWMGLNQDNHEKYKAEISTSSEQEQLDFLSSIIIGNILSFAKEIDWWIEEKIKVIPVLKEINVHFKNNKMTGFKGFFFTNIFLPDYIGLGQSPARGFGTIKGEKVH